MLPARKSIVAKGRTVAATAHTMGQHRTAWWISIARRVTPYRRRERGRAPDRGSATVELVIATPLLLLMLLLIVQAGVWMHATHVAQTAATRALDQARAQGGTAAAGQAAGTQTLAALGAGVLRDPRLRVTHTATEVRVDLDATATNVFPGFSWPVHASAVGPVERFTPSTERR